MQEIGEAHVPSGQNPSPLVKAPHWLAAGGVHSHFCAASFGTYVRQVSENGFASRLVRCIPSATACP
jgi:hypothetical protein